jgi:hypothetical protein
MIWTPTSISLLVHNSQITAAITANYIHNYTSTGHQPKFTAANPWRQLVSAPTMNQPQQPSSIPPPLTLRFLINKKQASSSDHRAQPTAMTTLPSFTMKLLSTAATAQLHHQAPPAT